jgi:hypothetical protein
MMGRRSRDLVLLALLLRTLPVRPAGAAPPDSLGAEKSEWAFGVSAALYVLPDEDDFVLPVLTADRGWLHLEGRHNYEDLETTSLFVGGNWGGGEEVEWSVTPMLGGVFGLTEGIAPAVILSLGWRRLFLYSENEVVFALDEEGEDFFYSWNELTGSPLTVLEIGLIAQRLRSHESGLEVERGVLLRLYPGGVSVTGYLMNPFSDGQFGIVAVEAEF